MTHVSLYSGDDRRTRVGHCKMDSTDVYVGRGPSSRDMNETQVGERGWLGNPYTVDLYDREESIEQFRSDFETRLAEDAGFRSRVRELSGAVLGCWCQRLDEDAPACHAEVIAEYADWLARVADPESALVDHIEKAILAGVPAAVILAGIKDRRETVVEVTDS